MKRLIECVPNFSEGRDPSKVDALVAAMSGVEGVWVLDRESDTDHNRSVITLAGEPEAVAEAALRGVGKAAELIDLTRHTGAHPRVGATDVGEPRLHPTAGATVVGARKFLIAYNINLNTPDIGTANKIAKTIRFSSGGLRYAKAMGVDLKARGLAQVSINLTDFEQTPIHRVFEMVKREAERYGCAIVGSEIVGLVPKKALEMTADFYLQLENFSPAQVLENRLAAALSGVPLESKGRLAGLAQPFLDAVAEPTATPGGGSVAALAGALAASLGQMVAGLSRKKKSQAAYVEQLSAAVAELRAAAEALAEAIDRDAASYEAVMAAAKLPKQTKEDERLREEAIQRATRGAAEVPLYVAETAVELYERLGQLEPISAASMLSDLRVGRL